MDCIICNEPLTDELTRLPCAHAYHTACFLRWYNESPSCPLCRRMPIDNAERQPTFGVSAEGRLRMLQTFARTAAADAAPGLVHLITLYKRAAELKRERQRELTAWRQSSDGQEFRRLLVEKRKHLNRRQAAHQCFLRARRALLHYPIPTLRMPNTTSPMILRQRRR